MSTGHAYLLSTCFNWPAEASFGVQDDCISPVPYACHRAARCIRSSFEDETYKDGMAIVVSYLMTDIAHRRGECEQSSITLLTCKHWLQAKEKDLKPGLLH